jgi:hypothetical protein
VSPAKNDMGILSHNECIESDGLRYVPTTAHASVMCDIGDAPSNVDKL